MIKVHLIQKPAFEVIGKHTWIAEQDNQLFGQFWDACQREGLFDQFAQLAGGQTGAQTKSSLLGVSCVEKDPAERAFYYLIAIEKPVGLPADHPAMAGLIHHTVPAALWAVFECIGKIPDALVASEMYAFTEWLPASGYEHAHAPEMEVYFPGKDGTSPDSYCEFWLPITPKGG